MANSSNSHRQSVFGGCFCLLAALFLYAPLAGAAWSAHSMACCTGDQCPIRGHHHQKPAASHEDCEHSFGMSACSMSCCQDQERVATSAVLFILPHLHLTIGVRLIVSVMEGRAFSEIPRSTQPVPPPPRVTPLIA